MAGCHLECPKKLLETDLLFIHASDVTFTLLKFLESFLWDPFIRLGPENHFRSSFKFSRIWFNHADSPKRDSFSRGKRNRGIRPQTELFCLPLANTQSFCHDYREKSFAWGPAYGVVRRCCHCHLGNLCLTLGCHYVSPKAEIMSASGM